MLRTLLLATALAGLASSPLLAQGGPDAGNPQIAALIEQAKAEASVASVGMPDSWANWKDSWDQITQTYGIEHFDTDMSSAQELAKFENEGTNGTADIGDVGVEFGPIGAERGLLQAYKPTTWDQIPDWAKDKDGLWAMPYTGTMAFIIRSDIADAPTSWADLMEGDYTFSMSAVGSGAQSNAAILAAAISRGGSETDLMPGIELFAELAADGRLRANEASPAALERGEIDVAALWDFNALNYAATVGAGKYTVVIPSDGSVTSGYASVINKNAPHPAAAKLAREYIFSDQGQINLANGYARPIRIDHITLPAETKSRVLPAEQYAKAKPIDTAAWQKAAPTLGRLWQENVLSEM